MLIFWWLTWEFFLHFHYVWPHILSTYPTIVSTYELVVDDTVDGKDNKEEMTRVVADIMMYQIIWNLGVIRCCFGGWSKSFYTFNMFDNIKTICVGAGLQCGWQGQPWGGNHGGWWHHGISLQLESLVFYFSLLASFSSFSTLMMSWTLSLTLKLPKTWMHPPSAQLITPPSSSKNILAELINHDATNLHGLLHLIVLAIYSVVDHQLDTGWFF